jgi:hypothetical protein
LGWKSFVIDLSRAWAWPVAVLIIVFAFREPLKDLVSQIENLRFRDFQLNFSQRIKTLKALAKGVLPTETLKIRTIRDTFTDLAKEDPMLQ